MWIKVDALWSFDRPDDISEIQLLAGVKLDYFTSTIAVNLEKCGVYAGVEMDGTLNGEPFEKNCCSVYVEGQEFILNMDVEEWEAILFGGQSLQEKWIEFLDGQGQSDNPNEG